jgi:hypothetical protein
VERVRVPGPDNTNINYAKGLLLRNPVALLHCSSTELYFSSLRAQQWDSVAIRDGICKSLKGPGNRFPAWRAGTTTLFVVPVRRAT